MAFGIDWCAKDSGIELHSTLILGSRPIREHNSHASFAFAHYGPFDSSPRLQSNLHRAPFRAETHSGKTGRMNGNHRVRFGSWDKREPAVLIRSRDDARSFPLELAIRQGDSDHLLKRAQGDLRVRRGPS